MPSNRDAGDAEAGAVGEEGPDQGGTDGGTPTGAQVVASDGEKIAAAVEVGVIARGDVVEAGGIGYPLTDSVDGGVDKADGWLTIGGGLLIDERGKPGPQGRGDAGTPPPTR